MQDSNPSYTNLSSQSYKETQSCKSASGLHIHRGNSSFFFQSREISWFLSIARSLIFFCTVYISFDKYAIITELPPLHLSLFSFHSECFNKLITLLIDYFEEKSTFDYTEYIRTNTLRYSLLQLPQKYAYSDISEKGSHWIEVCYFYL